MEFLSSPVGAAIRDLARREAPERSDREIDQWRIDGAPASLRHAADRAEQHHDRRVGGRRAVGRRPVQFRQHPARRHSAPARARAQLRGVRQGRRRAAALSGKGVRRQGRRDAGGLHLSAAGDLGSQEAHFARRHQGAQAAASSMASSRPASARCCGRTC